MKLAVLLFAGLISCTTTMSAKKHDTHEKHGDHKHASSCGHDSEKIDSKTVYSHDGHDHVVMAVTIGNKVSVHASHKHKHKKSCGHSSRKMDN